MLLTGYNADTTLAERRADPEDADGIPDRAIDWYDIGGLKIGSQIGRLTPREAMDPNGHRHLPDSAAALGC